MKNYSIIIVLLLIRVFPALSGNDTLFSQELSHQIEELMAKNSIPGLSVAYVEDGKAVVSGFGYANKEKKEKVTDATLFEIGSCSKAFTGLALLKLEHEGLVKPNDNVSKYLPWFHVVYNGEKRDITIDQLMHHTSGIPFKTISDIPQDSSKDALMNTVKTIVGVELNHAPGEFYEYATVNYDVIGLIIQQVTNKGVEDYIQDSVLTALSLKESSIGVPKDKNAFAQGYKIGFFHPIPFVSPVFRGNYPSGYVISNAKDMAKWVQIQLGIIDVGWDSIVQQSHLPDLTVAPSGDLSYASGWKVSQYGTAKIFHEGYNPSFSSYVVFFPGRKAGLVVLANANAAGLPAIAEFILASLTGEKQKEMAQENDRVDVFSSMACLIIGIYIICVLFLMFLRFKKIFSGKVIRQRFSAVIFSKIILVLLLGIPYLYGLYLIPEVLIGFSWKAIFIWAPVSFSYLTYVLLAGFVITYCFYFLSLFFQDNSQYKGSVLLILFLSVLSGLANTTLLFIITTSFYSSISLYYLLYYFGLIYLLYVVSIKIAQTKMIRLTNGITYNVRAYLMNKIIVTKFQNFEKLSDGRILTTLNYDTTVLANSANVFISFISNFITIFSAFLYMTTISLLSTLVVLAVVLILVWYYYTISKRARVFMEESRDIINSYTGLLNNMINGFRELSLHNIKKIEFAEEFIDVNRKFMKNSIRASIKFLDSSIVGNSFVMIILGILSIVMPRVTSATNTVTLISFVMVLLYIIGPINAVLGTIQQITMIRISWKRISDFTSDLEGSSVSNIGFWEMINSFKGSDKTEEYDLEEKTVSVPQVKNIDIENIVFEYSVSATDNDETSKTFTLGPLNLNAVAGDIVFIVGGNGSGKSTFLHLLTGLYSPVSGVIKINGKEINRNELGEYFSVIFSNGHLFQKIYGIDLLSREKEMSELLKTMELEDKVKISGNTFSTINLSSGQRKRLALLRCYLEDRPIFMFDEFAADQDPEFRAFFYKNLLPELKKRGKIIIAITHDDRYFDQADKIVDLGR